MTDRAAHQAQREAVRTGARSAMTPRRQVYQRALDEHLQLEEFKRRQSERAPEHLIHHTTPAKGRHSDGHLRHEELVIDGRAVEVTEDNLGVVELTLPTCQQHTLL
jgi:hypothetical protein